MEECVGRRSDLLVTLPPDQYAATRSLAIAATAAGFALSVDRLEGKIFVMEYFLAIRQRIQTETKLFFYTKLHR